VIPNLSQKNFKLIESPLPYFYGINKSLQFMKENYEGQFVDVVFYDLDQNEFLFE
jgi:hypothetical protein